MRTGMLARLLGRTGHRRRPGRERGKARFVADTLDLAQGSRRRRRAEHRAAADDNIR